MAAVEADAMGWVVKSWRPEGVAAVLGEQMLEAAREVMEGAEREARRWHRVARRERAVADDELQRLEEMGEELLQRVRLQRASIRLPDEPDPVGEIEVRDLRPSPRARQRARLRDSPLAGLFAATGRRMSR